MDTSCRDEEDVAGLHLVARQDIDDTAVGHLLGVLLGPDLLLEAGQQRGARPGIHDVPHLGLAQLAVTLAGQFVVGMHLDGEVSGGIDEFHQQGELRAVGFGDMLAHQFGSELPDQFAERATGQLAILHYGFTPAYGADFPALADIASVGGQPLEGFQATASPDDFFQVIFE